jgi:cell pole-organizing protein PopZ
MSSMADKTPDQEPSIEEILASIRQIISDDDDKDTGAAPAAAPNKKAAPEPEPVPEEPEEVEEPEEEEDVLELTEADALAVPEPEPEEAEEEYIEVELQDVEEEPLPEKEIPAMPTPEPQQTNDDDSILSSETRKAAVFSMAKLAGNMPINRPNHSVGSVTLEDIVREILNPMLRDWMDHNLPPMVERIVQKELEKLARQVMDE